MKAELNELNMLRSRDVAISVDNAERIDHLQSKMVVDDPLNIILRAKQAKKDSRRRQKELQKQTATQEALRLNRESMIKQRLEAAKLKGKESYESELASIQAEESQRVSLERAEEFEQSRRNAFQLDISVSQNSRPRPTYQGMDWFNRFNIKPGYRWDGVDRSNGWEKQISAFYAKKRENVQREHDWSVSEM